jgi:tetratricopeptide (TPR) repeat protein
MKIAIKSGAFQFLMIATELAAFLLVTAWIAKIYVAQEIAKKPNVSNLQRAIRWDPDNSEHHVALGRLYEYAPESADPQKAVEQFRYAVELNPYNVDAWLNLAAVSEFQGKISEAAAYLQKADYLAPYLPEFQWSIGNFYLLHGDTTEAFRHFKVVLAGTRQYDQLIFRLAWKSSGDAGVILQDLIPDDLPAEFSYLSYLMTLHQYGETQPVWERIVGGTASFRPQQAAGYIDGLIAADEPAKAFQVWTDLEKKGVLRYASSAAAENLVTNGGFEDEMLDAGFGWRISPIKGAYAGLDTSNYHSPGHALLVGFAGKENLFYRQAFQYIKVSPATSYRLQAFMMTDGITTDSGPRLEVRDAYDPQALDQMTSSMTGTSKGWSPLLLDFKTGSKTELIVLSLTRLPSQKLDNLIAGKVWLDDVRMAPLGK